MTVLISSGRCREDASGVRGAVSGEDVFASHANNHLTTGNSPYSMPPYFLRVRLLWNRRAALMGEAGESRRSAPKCRGGFN